MPDKFAAECFHTNKLCSKLASKRRQIMTAKKPSIFVLETLRGNVHCSC